MLSLAHLLAPIALLLPVTVGEGALAPGIGDSVDREDLAVSDQWRAAVDPTGPPLAPPSVETPLSGFMAKGLADDSWNQVRIEQRLIIRIAPRLPGRDSFMPPPMPQFSQPQMVTPRFRERKVGKCVPVGAIAGVQVVSDQRLMLMMRDRRMIGANLDKACSARDFYSGFYVEQTPDGQLCTGRDTIHSRAGATCTINGLREMIPDE
jgi:hypothetical protein